MSDNKKKGCFSRIFQYTLFLINIVFMVFLVISSRAWYHPPTEGLYYAFFGLTYVVWLTVNVIFFIWWLICRRWLFSIVQVVVFLICWSTICTYIPINFKTSEKNIPHSRIKILTYNVDALQSLTKEKARVNPIFEYINSQDADVVCMQEMSVIIEEDVLDDIITLKEVEAIFSKYPFVHYQTNFISGKRRSGLMILSKYPIVNIQKIDLGSTFNGAFIVLLDVDGKNVHIMNAHLESNRITESDKQLYKEFIKNSNKEITKKVEDNIKERMGRGYNIREKQTNIIQDLLKHGHYNYLSICGDFNDTPMSYTYEQMTAKNRMKDSFYESGCGMGITFREYLFPFRLDYILHTPNMQSYNTYVDHVDYSDHYPVITYLELK